jgi:5-dehydro-4-deoxyglucarate dehydratase
MTMSPSELRAKLQGVVGFPVTPFKADLTLDLDGLRRNLRAMLQHPPAAIVAAGGTGELYSLSPAEHQAVVRAAVEESAGRVPVIAGAGFNGPIAAALARQAAEAGASGILAFPPYYPGGEDDGLVDYYSTIGKATDLGLLIYSRDWFHPSASLVERLTSIPNLVAWKDGQGDIRRLQILRARVGDRLHWIGGAGDDLVPAYYGIGIRAFTSSVANVSSKVAWQLHETASRGDAAALQALMTTFVVPLYVLRARRRGYEVSVMKVLMDLLGMAGGPVRPPLAMLKAEEVDMLRATVPSWKASL